jgi:uncharacterized membrane protein YqjE
VFDTVAGLPVHALVVHAVVVLLPLMALVTIAVAVRPAWRGAAGFVVVADLLVVGAVYVAKESGEKFQSRLSGTGANVIAKDHGDQGALLPWFAVALLVAAVVVWLGRRSKAVAALGIVLAVVTGLAAIGWTVEVGHSGATAVWGGVINSSATGS